MLLRAIVVTSFCDNFYTSCYYAFSPPLPVGRGLFVRGDGLVGIDMFKNVVDYVFLIRIGNS